MKTYNSAGVSRSGGKFALRCTNREAGVYADILTKEGHEDVNIIKLKTPMSKDDARKHLSGLKAFQDPKIQECLKGEKPAKKTEAKKDAKGGGKAAKTAAPKTSKASKSKTKGGGKGKMEPENNPDVPTAEADHSEAVDAATELGMSEPAFMKHTQSEA